MGGATMEMGSKIRLDEEKIKAQRRRCGQAFVVSGSPASRLPNEAFSCPKIKAAVLPFSRGASLCYWQHSRRRRREQGLAPRWNLRSSLQDLLAKASFRILSLLLRTLFSAQSVAQLPNLQLVEEENIAMRHFSAADITSVFVQA